MILILITLLSLSFSDELKLKEDRLQKLQSESRHILESLAILLSTPSHFVDSLESAIKDRIREILNENKEKTAVINNQQNLIRFFILCRNGNFIFPASGSFERQAES